MSRTARWDRPPPRRNARWFVRLVGKTLIVIGLLTFGFAAYQLWGTGIEYARAQHRAENQFEQLIATVPRATTSTAATTATAPTTTIPGSTSPRSASRTVRASPTSRYRASGWTTSSSPA